MATNGSFESQEQLKNSDQATNVSVESSSSNANLSKDEVGWYFVEQYYTTLSKTPEKLHLFYSKRSQFVYGKEAEVATVSVGRAAIQERIKELDFQDCKVRVTNVDSMASFDNIVIQVIGETSNRGGESRKFCQTFVLAPQPSGYFVVNDILRFVSEEEQEEAVAPAPEEPAVAEAEEAPVSETEEKEAEIDVAAVDEKLEQQQEAPAAEAAPAAAKPEVAVPELPKVEAAPESKPAEAAVDAEAAAREIAEEDVKEQEKPVDPSPTPNAAAQAAERPAPAPAAPAAPAKPLSWASRAAAAVGTKPVVPVVPKTATPPAQNKSAPAKSAAAPAAGTPAAPAPAAAAQQGAAPAQQPTDPKESSEWQSVSDSKRQNRPQSISGPPADNGTLGYVKYVTEKIDTEELRSVLQRHGELTYFDVNRQKNCAFVEFATAAGYQAAVGANPHVINGENIVVEPRRPKAGAYGGSNYSSSRGGVPARGGRGGFDGQRSGSQGGGRGGFTPGQGRGRGGAPRGRGASQAAANA
ncbi:NTF2 and RRM domain-containing protein [Plectosphaerella cucumerina]|uniref:NTF2 and RRM domain-containing protein n=1 Tax=Plectosphaerella cucumerina TaxID=40658 RepID=A0A8K0THC2_9PEZI|nr:NTF2 and RRM domain-containing protein [Plectosphaerella cucumerina]